MAIGVLPSAGWASCLWLDLRRMNPPVPSRDGLIIAANQCPRNMSFAFGEWSPKSGALKAWSEKLSADGETGNYVFLAVKPDYVMVGTPCESDCKAEKAYFMARRTFTPGQTVIWIPPPVDP